MKGTDYVYPSPVIAERIQELFDKNHLKDGQVAKILKCDRKSILAYRHAERNPSIKFVRYMCATYHVSADWLLDLKGGRE